ncbi:MAG: hypothetical protein L0338_24335 [Acidobacteria bacterium]|nr:hypothetical protein [Acidobacteriota bacterium]
MDRDVRSKDPGPCSKCGMKLIPSIKEQLEYPLRLLATPPQIPTGKLIRLEFEVCDPSTGKPVDQFEIVHERRFHLFIVSQELDFFEHVHPEQSGERFVLDLTLPKPGVYRMLADFYPVGGVPQFVPLTVTTAGYAAPVTAAVLQTDLEPKKGENIDVELTMEPHQPIAGKKTMLFFRLRPTEQLEPFLGAWGHLLAASDDLIDLIHAHPFLADGSGQVQFNVFFPRESTYRIWVQFQRSRKVNTVHFTFPVSQLK